MRWDQSKLEQHGDPYESLWGHFLKDDFPEWERFWARHVVPLTNRIDDKKKNGQAKLFLRDDPTIHKGIEALMMANYSVFYYLARSCVIVASEPHLFPEDAFIFLRATTENVREFLHVFTTRLAHPLNIDKNRVPKYADIEDTEVAKAIDKYRNAFVHYSRLGRNPNLAWEFIPNTSHVHKSKLSWRYVQNLPEDQFIDSRTYLRELQRGLMKVINPVWKQITLLLDERRTSEAYLKFYRLYKDASGDFRPIKFG
jgi:hypothetical protein